MSKRKIRMTDLVHMYHTSDPSERDGIMSKIESRLPRYNQVRIRNGLKAVTLTELIRK